MEIEQWDQLCILVALSCSDLYLLSKFVSRINMSVKENFEPQSIKEIFFRSTILEVGAQTLQKVLKKNNSLSYYTEYAQVYVK